MSWFSSIKTYIKNLTSPSKPSTPKPGYSGGSDLAGAVDKGAESGKQKINQAISTGKPVVTGGSAPIKSGGSSGSGGSGGGSKKLQVSSINPNSKTDASYQISKGEALKSSVKQLGTNVKLSAQSAFGFGSGKDMSWSQIWSNSNNPLKSFEYATPPEAKRVIKNPFYKPLYSRTTSMSEDVAPVESKRFITKQELYDKPIISFEKIGNDNFLVSTPRISSEDVSGRQFSASGATTFLKTAGVIGTSIALPPAGVAYSMKEFTLSLGRASNPNLPVKNRLLNLGGAGLSLAGVGAFATITYAKASASLRQATIENLQAKDKLIPYKGIRVVQGERATDMFGKEIKTGLGSFESKGLSGSKIVGDNKFVTSGESISKTSVKDYWSGKTLSSTSKDLISSKGILLPTQKGITPSLGKSNTFTLSKLDTQTGNPMNIRLDIFPKGFKPQASNFGGRTSQYKDYIFSQSGKLGQFKTKQEVMGLFEDKSIQVKTTKSFTFGKDSSAILKIFNKGTGESGGTSTIFRGFGQVSQLKTSQIPFTAPKVTMQSITQKSISALPIFGGGTFLSSGLISGVTTKQTSQTKTSLILPKTSFSVAKPEEVVKTIPVVNTAPKIIKINRTKQIPAVIPAEKVIVNPVIELIPSPTLLTPFNPIKNITGQFPKVAPPKFDIGGELDMSKGLKNFPAKMRYRYTPDFKSLVYGIKGKAPSKKIFSGFESRPIPKGFSWSSTFGKALGIKVKKVKGGKKKR